MGWLRGLGRIAGLGLLAVLLLPALAPWIGSAVDRGPDGIPRLSAFPIALAAFDPLLRECARNSSIVAGLVAGGSLVVGVVVGELAASRRFWGRAPLVILVKLPLAAGPILIAPGVVRLMGGPSGWDWLAARSLLGWSCEDLARWVALVWVGMAWGVPMVALATGAARRRSEPAWVEAARAVGASPARSWRDVVWPALRPEAARAAASVFAIALVEPAGPMVLGLRRTLAVPMIEAASRLDQPTRAATLALLAILISTLARAAILGWGGPSRTGPGREPAAPTIAAGRRRSLGSVAILGAWSAVAAGPVGALIWLATDPAEGVSIARWSGLLVGWLADPEARVWAVNAGLAGLLAVGVDLLVLRAISGRGPIASKRAIGPALRVFEVVPPMALAVGALSLPWLLGALADAVDGPIGRVLRAVALELSPARSPGWLLIAAIAAGRLPTLARAADLAGERSRPALAEASLLMGASRRSAARAGQNRWLGIVPVRPMVLSLALSSTALAPALLLAPGSERRTLAPAVLGSLLGPGPVDPRIAGAIAGLLAVNFLGFALASRGRSGPLGDWFRV